MAIKIIDSQPRNALTRLLKQSSILKFEDKFLR